MGRGLAQGRPSGRLIGGVTAAFCAVYALVFLYLVWRAAVLQPYADEFEWIARWYALKAHGDWAAYFKPYNFHRMIWTLGAQALDIRLFGGQGWLPIALSTVCALAAAALLAREGAAAAEPGLRLPGAAAAAALTLLPSTALVASQAIDGTYLHALVFALAALVLATPARAGAGVTAGRLAALACLVGAAFGSAAGLAVWPVLVFGAWRGGARWSWRLTVLIAGAAFVGLYALGQSEHGVVAAPSPSLHGAVQSILLGLNYLALPWVRAVPRLGWAFGLLVLALAAAALLRCGGREAPRSERLAVQLILFSLGTAAMAALGRADQGPPSDVPVRYAPFLAPLHVGLLLIVLPRFARWQLRRPAEAQALVMVAALLLLGHELAAGVFVVRTGDMIRQTIVDFRAGVRTPPMLKMIHPRLDFAEALERRMRADGLYQTELHLKRPLAANFGKSGSKVEGFCCQAPSEPRLALLRR